MNQNAQKLRQALQQQSYLMMPGIYDCLSAKMAENAGFQAAFFSGGAFSMATLGKPDIGFFNLTEAVHTLRRIVDSVNIPILSDGNNGFGNAIHAADTARAFETIGVAGIQVDDQVLPQSIPCTSKECNEWRYVEPKLIAIRKAVSPEFVILFRTIANITDDLDKAIWRINRAAELGADYAYVDGLKSYEEAQQVAAQAKIPLLINMNEKGACAKVPLEQIKALNYRIGLYPVASVTAAAQAYCDLFRTIHETGSTLGYVDSMYSIKQLMNDMGLQDLTDTYLPLYQE